MNRPGGLLGAARATFRTVSTESSAVAADRSALAFRAVTPTYRTTVDPAAAGFDLEALDVLRSKVSAQVDEGRMPACQLAFGVDGELAVFESYGTATDDTRFVVFSATKALIAAVMWQLLAEGALSTETRVIELIPRFGQDGRTPEWMAAVTVEQLMTHTSGFPYAPLGPPRWDTREGRLEVFARWHATFEPGTHFEYHPTAAHWVLAELIEVSEGRDYRDVVNERVVQPLGLQRLVFGSAAAELEDVADLEIVGEPASMEELAELFGQFDPALLGEVTPDALMSFNQPAVRGAGVPGAGAVATAADLAILYQHFLHDPTNRWDPDLLVDATRGIRCALPNMIGVPANRSLGLVVAGDDGLAKFRGMGPTVSPSAFGHNGAAGQIVWADPASGLSFTLLTSGVDPHVLREARRIVSLAAAAGRCRNPQ